MLMKKTEALKREIDNLRSELQDLIETRHCIDSPDIMKLSKKLDEKLNKYNEIMTNK